MFQQSLFDGGEKLSIENREGKFNTERECNCTYKIYGKKLRVKNCGYGDDANCEVETKKFRFFCNYAY